MAAHNAQTSHLRWIEVKDFSPGLYETGDWLMPPTAAQTMQDCYPQEGGGLRAFMKADVVNVTGVQDITHERVIGVHARGGIAARSGAPTDLTDRYLMTYYFNSGNLSGHKGQARLYRMDGTNSESTWTQILKTGAVDFEDNDNNAPQKASFRVFRLTSGAVHVILAVRTVTTDAGIYSLNYSDLSSAQVAALIDTSASGAAHPIGALAIHQNRVMITSGGRVMWSEAGVQTFDADAFLLVDPNVDLPTISAIALIEPSDFLGVREGAPAFVVQGEIDDPVVQELGEGIAFHTAQDFAPTPDGLTIIGADGRIYITDGRSFQNISAQIHAFSENANSIVAMGDTNYLDGFVFAPGGYVFDTRTNSWFTQTQIAGSFHNVERYTGQIWGPVSNGVSFTLKKLSPKNSTARLSTYTWKSAPLRSDDGRQIRVRAVQIYATPYDSSATIQVTVNGTSHTVTLDGSTTRQSLDFLFNERAEVLDVTVVSTAGSASNEAPSIESVRIGVGIGHLT